MLRKDWWSVLKKDKDEKGFREDELRDDDDDFPEEGGMKSEEEQQEDAWSGGPRIGDMIDEEALKVLAQFGQESEYRLLTPPERYDEGDLGDDVSRFYSGVGHIFRDRDNVGAAIQELLVSTFLLAGADMSGVDAEGRAVGTSRKAQIDLRRYIKLTNELYEFDGETEEWRPKEDKESLAVRQSIGELDPGTEREKLQDKLEGLEDEWKKKSADREALLKQASGGLEFLCQQMGYSGSSNDGFTPEMLINELAKLFVVYIGQDAETMQGIGYAQPEFDEEAYLAQRENLEAELASMTTEHGKEAAKRNLMRHTESAFAQDEETQRAVGRSKNKLFEAIMNMYQALQLNTIAPVISYNRRKRGEMLLARAQDIIEGGNLPNMWAKDLDAIYGANPQNVNTSDPRPASGYASYNPNLFDHTQYREGGPLSKESLLTNGREGIERLAGELGESLLGCHAIQDLLGSLDIEDEARRRGAVEKWVAHMLDPRTHDMVMASEGPYYGLLDKSAALTCPECSNGDHQPFVKDAQGSFSHRLLNPNSDQLMSKGKPASMSATEAQFDVIRERRKDLSTQHDKARRLMEIQDKMAQEGDEDKRQRLYTEFTRLKQSMMTPDEIRLLPPVSEDLSNIDMKIPTYSARARRDTEALEEAGVFDADYIRRKGRTAKFPMVRNPIGLERDLMETMLNVPGSSADQDPKTQMHLSERSQIHDYSTDAAQLQAEWDYLKAQTNPDIFDKDPGKQSWNEQIRAYCKMQKNAFLRLEQLEKASTDTKELKKLQKMIKVASKGGSLVPLDELHEAIKEPLQWHLAITHLMDSISTRTHLPVWSHRGNIQALGPEEDFDLQGFSGWPSPPRSKKDILVHHGAPTKERLTSAPRGDPRFDDKPPLLRYVYEKDKEGKTRVVMGKARVRDRGTGKVKEVDEPVAVPTGWQGGALAGSSDIFLERKPDEARFIDPTTGGRINLTDFMLRRARQTEAPHLRKGVLHWDDEIAKKVEKKVEDAISAFEKRTQNNYGQPHSTTLGHIQPHEVSPLAIVGLQHGFPSHIDSNDNLSEEEKSLYKKVFHHTMTGGNLFSLYGLPEDLLTNPDAYTDQNGYPMALQMIVKEVMAAITGDRSIDMYSNAEGIVGDTPRYLDHTFTRDNKDIHHNWHKTQWDVLDALVNPEARLKKMRAQMGVSVDENGVLTVRRNEQNARNPTGGFERCHDCYGDGHLDFDRMANTCRIWGLVPSNTSDTEISHILMRLMEEGRIQHWGDAEGWESQYEAEAPHRMSPLKNSSPRSIRYQCPSCSGEGICGGNHPERKGHEEYGALAKDAAHNFHNMLGLAHDFARASALESSLPIKPGPQMIPGESLDSFFERNSDLDPLNTSELGVQYNQWPTFKSRGDGVSPGTFYGTDPLSFSGAIRAAIDAHASTRSMEEKELANASKMKRNKPVEGSEDFTIVQNIQAQLRAWQKEMQGYNERLRTKRLRGGRIVPPIWSDQHYKNKHMGAEKRDLPPLTKEEHERMTYLRQMMQVASDQLFHFNAGDTFTTATQKAEQAHSERMAAREDIPEPEKSEAAQAGEHWTRRGDMSGKMHHAGGDGELPWVWAVDKGHHLGTPSSWNLIGEEDHHLKYDDDTKVYLAHKEKMQNLSDQRRDESLSDADRKDIDDRLSKLEDAEGELWKNAQFNLDFKQHFDTADDHMKSLAEEGLPEEERRDIGSRLSAMPPLSRILQVGSIVVGGKVKKLKQWLVFPRLDGACPAEYMGRDYIEKYLGDDALKNSNWEGALGDLERAMALQDRISSMVQPVLDVIKATGMQAKEVAELSTDDFNKLLDKFGITSKNGEPLLGVTDSGGPHPLMHMLKVHGPSKEVSDGIKSLEDIVYDLDVDPEERERAEGMLAKLLTDHEASGADTFLGGGFLYHPSLGVDSGVGRHLDKRNMEFVDSQREHPGLQYREDYKPSQKDEAFTVNATPVQLKDIEALTGDFTAHKFAIHLAKTVLWGGESRLPGMFDDDGDSPLTMAHSGTAGPGGSLSREMVDARQQLAGYYALMAQWAPNRLLSYLRGAGGRTMTDKERLNHEQEIARWHPGLDFDGPRTEVSRWKDAIPLGSDLQVNQASEMIANHTKEKKRFQDQHDWLREVNKQLENQIWNMQYEGTYDAKEADEVRRLIEANQSEIDEEREMRRQYQYEFDSAIAGRKADDGIPEHGLEEGGWRAGEGGEEKTVRFTPGGWEQKEDEDFRAREAAEEPWPSLAGRDVAEHAGQPSVIEHYIDENGVPRQRIVAVPNYDEDRRRLSEAISGVGAALPFSPESMEEYPILGAHGEGEGPIGPWGLPEMGADPNQPGVWQTSLSGAPPSLRNLPRRVMTYPHRESALRSAPSQPYAVSEDGRIIPQEEYPEHDWITTRPPSTTNEAGDIVPGVVTGTGKDPEDDDTIQASADPISQFWAIIKNIA